MSSQRAHLGTDAILGSRERMENEGWVEDGVQIRDRQQILWVSLPGGEEASMSTSNNISVDEEPWAKMAWRAIAYSTACFDTKTVPPGVASVPRRIARIAFSKVAQQRCSLRAFHMGEI